jgi:LacI family transcriptional regulator
MLAKRLHLSIATVSRSLQDHPDIARATKARVIAEAERMGYQPRQAAVEDGPTFGVLVACPDQPQGSPLDSLYLMGMSQAAHERNVTLFTHYLSEGMVQQILEPAHQPGIMRRGGTTGLILLHQFPDAVVEQLSHATRVVTLAHAYLDTVADLVDSDHVAGMDALIGHLAGLGHRRIGYIMRQSSVIPYARLGSLVRAVTRRSLSLEPGLFLDLPLATAVAEERKAATPDVIAAQAATISTLIERIKAGTTAWACDSDATAYWIYRLLRARGLRIPEDVSLTGFDGFDPYPDCPQVTTIRVPFIEMGRLAVTHLAQHARNQPATPQQLGVRGALIVGATTGVRQAGPSGFVH